MTKREWIRPKVSNKVKSSGQECPLHTCKILFCVLHLLAGFVVDGEFFGYWFQRGIKLPESVLDCGVVLVALPAGVSFRHGFGGLVAVAVNEVSPFVGEPGGIFYFD